MQRLEELFLLDADVGVVHANDLVLFALLGEIFETSWDRLNGLVQRVAVSDLRRFLEFLDAQRVGR